MRPVWTYSFPTRRSSELEQLPAFIRRGLEQGLVDRDEGDVGADGGLAVRGPHLDARFGGVAHRIGLFVGLDLNAEPVPLPADLDPGDAAPVAWLGAVDERGGRGGLAPVDVGSDPALPFAPPAFPARHVPRPLPSHNTAPRAVGCGGLAPTTLGA